MKTGIKNRVTLYSSFHIGYMASSLQPVLTENFNVIQAGLVLVDGVEHSLYNDGYGHFTAGTRQHHHEINAGRI